MPSDCDAIVPLTHIEIAVVHENIIWLYIYNSKCPPFVPMFGQVYSSPVS